MKPHVQYYGKGMKRKMSNGRFRYIVGFLVAGAAALLISFNIIGIQYILHDYELRPLSSAESKPAIPSLAEVDCRSVESINPVNIGRMTSHPEYPYLVSFSWWDGRLRKENFKVGNAVKGNPSVHAIQSLLQNTTEDAAFIDIGANVGFMTHFGLSLGRPVYGVDPISYDIAKICEGYKANIEKSWAKPNQLHLYHAAAGPEYQPNITIVRPSDEVGFFDQSSLTRDAINAHDVTEEHVPMITVDSIIPPEMSVGVVKIDVQGHEYGVFQGMKQLLGRSKRYPKYIFFEEVEGVLKSTGVEFGASTKFVESFGYHCQQQDQDVLCEK